jgi:tRNA (guanine37-N1)-methyltransferase
MLAAYTELKNAEKVKTFLATKKLLNLDYLVVKELDHIYFPLTKKVKVSGAKVVNTKFKFPEKEKPATIDELLKGKLTAKEMKLIPRSLEVVGKIMVIEVPDELKKKEKLIAQAYLKQNHNIETVVKKDQIHSGEFRLRKVKILAGKRTKETIHFENGVKIKLDLEKTYFSARSANERLRIARLIKPKEEVLVMFSGAGPFPLVIAKNSHAKLVYGIEINPLAHQYALTNVSLNHLDSRVAIFNGDVRDLLPKVRKKFDRIAMPLPKTGDQFLGLALKKIKDNGTIHLYDFLSEDEFAVAAKNIREICKKNKKRCRILRKVKCGQFSPSVFRICFDIKVKK